MAVKAVNDLSNFIGQANIIESLKNEIGGAKMLGQPTRDLLLVGNAGVGKTTLTRHIAGQIGVNIHELCGTRILKLHHLSELIKTMQAFEILFCDEIHVTDHAIQEALQRVMTDRIISGFQKDALTGKWKQAEDIRVPPITIIAATDRPGALLKALLSRFGTPVAMRLYSVDELKRIIRAKACQLNLLLTDTAATKIAESCTGIPREAMQRLDVIQKYAAIKQISQITPEAVQECLALHGINALGLGPLEQEYLKVVYAASFSGLRLITLETVLSVDARFIQRNIEPKLIQLGLVKIDLRRRITLKGAQCVERDFQ